MNAALWYKTMREGRWLLLGSGAFLFGFHLIQVYVTSFFTTSKFHFLLKHVMPKELKDLFPVPPEVAATPLGRLAIGYEDPVVVVLLSSWAIARGSDAVAGELGRGTMEMLLAQPVRRTTVLGIQAAFTLFGLAVLATCGWLGTLTGTSIFELEMPVDATILLGPALNLFSLGVFLAGLTTLISSAGRYRGRTIGLVVGIYFIQTIFKILSKTVPDLESWRRLSILTLFEPQVMAYRLWPDVLEEASRESWEILCFNNGILILSGLLCYVLAAIVFSRRDLPAPL